MGDFRDTTKTIAGHHNVSAVHPGPIRPTGGTAFRNLTEREPSHNFSGSATVRRQVPSNELQAEAGGKSDLTPGYAGGGRHFHVHKHYWSGGRVIKTTHKSYTRRSRQQMEMQAEKKFSGNPGRRGGFKTGGTINCLKEGGSCETGDTRNKMAKGGKWIQGAIKRPGAFTAKAKKAGMGVQAYASKVTKEGSGASSRTKRQANLAKTLGKMHKASGGPVTRAATGGTINRYGAGGALYKKGGESSHERSAEHTGFRGQLSNLRSKLED